MTGWVSFVWGNPINYTDPTGYDVDCTIGDNGCHRKPWLKSTIEGNIGKDSGLTDDGRSTVSGLTSIMMEWHDKRGKLPSGEELLGLTIAIEYFGPLGNDSDMNGAMARKYRNYCGEGAFSTSCINGFWAYMQATLRGDVDTTRYWLQDTVTVTPKRQTATEVAHAILHPNEQNIFGITPAMNNCNNHSYCGWATISAIANGDFYKWVVTHSGQWIPKKTSDGITLVVNDLASIELCGSKGCSFVYKTTEP